MPFKIMVFVETSSSMNNHFIKKKVFPVANFIAFALKIKQKKCVYIFIYFFLYQQFNYSYWPYTYTVLIILSPQRLQRLDRPPFE